MPAVMTLPVADNRIQGGKVVNGAWFDNLSRALHGKVGSRRALASAVAGLSVLTISQVDADAKGSKGKRKKNRKKKQANQEAERSVLLLESLVEQLKAVSGDCGALTRAASAFQQQYAADLNQIAAIEQQWDAATRIQLVTKYETRITQATESLHTMMTACRFRGAPEAAICTATGGAQTQTPNSPSFNRPATAQCGAGCDCSCICPISGWECAGMFFGCMGGTEAACCWFGACAGHICAQQCPNCCNCGPTCCNC